MPRERPGCVLPLNNHEVLATNQWCKPNAENEVAALRWPFGLPFGREHFVVARAMLRRRPLMPNGNGSPKGNPEGLGEMMKRVLHAVQLAPIGIITRPNIAQRAQQCRPYTAIM